MDSACCLSVSVGTVPVSVTTPLSRSSLTFTSLNPAWSKDFRMLSVTSGDLSLEQLESIPATSSGSTEKINFLAFMSLLVCARATRNLGARKIRRVLQDYAGRRVRLNQALALERSGPSGNKMLPVRN